MNCTASAWWHDVKASLLGLELAGMLFPLGYTSSVFLCCWRFGPLGPVRLFILERVPAGVAGAVQGSEGLVWDIKGSVRESAPAAPRSALFGCRAQKCPSCL